MKKSVLFKFVLVLIVYMAVIVSAGIIVDADVAWEPVDSFYERHADELERTDAELIANGPGGSVTIWKNPVSAQKLGKIENGEEVYVQYIYTDKRGYEWGIVLRGAKTGWVPMDYLVAEPGLNSFTAKHRDEFQEYEGQYKVPEGVEDILFWSYPGSGEVVNSRSIDKGESIGITFSYTDKDERQWGYVVYFQAADGWICLTDPSNDSIPVNEEDAATVSMPPEPTIIIKPQSEGIGTIILISILTIAVVGVTVILIRVFYKKNKGNNTAS